MISRPKPRGSVILKIIIVFLIALLVYTIWEPFDIIRTDEEHRAESRTRMAILRNTQILYFTQNRTYQRDIDSLITWLTTDSLAVARQDSLIRDVTAQPVNPEDLKYSPRSHEKYTILVDDTSSTHRYRIECPDSYGFVSDLDDVSQLHRASWE
jgi:hypothetical protein